MALDETVKKRVLIAEDKDLLFWGMQIVVQRIPDLELIGRAHNGQEAVEMARELQPDMVLMDVLMPELDGISATRTIKEELPDIKILMLTGLDDPAVISDSLQAGADGFCPKYLSSEQLIAAIKTVGEGNMWLPSLYANQLRKTLSLSERVAQPAGISADVKYGRLSKREQEVLQLMVSGLNNREIADRLVLSAETVKTHVRHIFEKMAVKRRTEAVLEALRLGLVSAA